MNPLTVLPARARLYVYAALALAALIYSAWQAAAGDWGEFAGGIITALVNMQAGANVPAADQTAEEVDNGAQ